jgi:BlaI family penicillinase repressor
MPQLPDISAAEWKIMKVLWAKSPLGAYDIAEALNRKQGWHPNTVRTLLTRLRQKRAVSIKKYKNLYLYQPRLSEEDCLQAESESFLERLFGGSVRTLLVHFVKRQKLTKADLDVLRRILEEES